MKYLVCMIMLMVTSVSYADEPRIDTQIDLLIKANQQLRDEIAALRGEIELIKQLGTGNESSEGVPEIEVMKRTPGVHRMHPQVGVQVYAKSEWIRYRKGGSEIIELIRDGNRIVPVDSITYSSKEVMDLQRENNRQQQQQSLDRESPQMEMMRQILLMLQTQPRN